MLQFYQFPIGDAGARGFDADVDACNSLARDAALMSRLGIGAGAALWIPDGRFTPGLIGENDYFRQLERSGVAGPQLIDTFTKYADPRHFRNLIAYIGQNWATGWSSPTGSQAAVLYRDYIDALLRFKARAGEGSGLTGIARDASNNQIFALASTDAGRSEALATQSARRTVEAAGLNFMWEGLTAGRPGRSWAFTNQDPGWGAGQSLANYEDIDSIINDGDHIQALAVSKLANMSIGPSILIYFGAPGVTGPETALMVAYHCYVLAGLASVDPVAARRVDAAGYFRPAAPFTQQNLNMFISDLYSNLS